MPPDSASSSSVSTIVTALVAADAQVAFRFLADPLALGGWSLGCMGTQPDGRDGLYRGRSLFDGAVGWFEIEPHPGLLVIDYLVGTQELRKKRISARVIPASECDLPEGECYVSLIAWRPASMTEPRWQRLCAAHEAEIWLIKAQIESGYRPD